MKILIIGKNGQLGSEIYKQSKKRGYETYAFDRGELDISDNEKVNEKIKELKPDIVFNASAYHVVPECEVYPDRAFQINAVALKNLAEVCGKYNITLVHYSTDYVFDGLKGSAYTEEDNPNPLQMYGISKLAGENIVLNYSPIGLIIRTCGVYGGKKGSRSKKGNFALNILRQAEKEKIIEVSSEQIVNPTYAVDLVKATLELLGNKKINGIYHLVNEGYCSWAEFASEIIKLVGSKTKIIPVDRKGIAGKIKRPLFSALKNVKAAKFGVKLPSWQDAIKRYILTLN